MLTCLHLTFSIYLTFTDSEEEHNCVGSPVLSFIATEAFFGYKCIFDVLSYFYRRCIMHVSALRIKPGHLQWAYARGTVQLYDLLGLTLFLASI
jgi:hypothetical protein